MEIQTQLANGIKAAKQGRKTQARTILYQVLDQEPRNETAWVWLSYVVETPEDRQVCLENVLTLNPENQYAQRGLIQLRRLALTQPVGLSAAKPPKKKAKNPSRPLPFTLVIAFWAGIGLLCFSFGLIDIVQWGIDLLNSRNFPIYITTYQLFSLAVSVAIFVFGVVSANLAWALYKGHRSGFYVSIILCLGLIMAGPAALIILGQPNYVLVMFMVTMPASILILTLTTQMDLVHEQQLAPGSE